MDTIETPDGLSLLATTDTAVYGIPVFATPEADRLLGGFSRSPRTWFLGAHSPFVFIQEGGVQAIDLSVPAGRQDAGEHEPRRYYRRAA